MSSPKSADLVIQWSSRGISAYDARTGRITHELSDFSGRSAVLAIGRRSVFLRVVRLPKADPETLRLLISQRLTEWFPLGGGDLAFDLYQTADANDAGVKTLIAAMPTADLRVALATMQQSRISVAAVVPAALASVALGARAGVGDGAIVQRDDEGVAVDILQGGIPVYSRVSPFSTDLAAEVCRTFAVAGVPCGAIVAAGGMDWAEADHRVEPNALISIAQAVPSELHLELPDAILARKQRQQSSRMRLSVLLLAAVGALGVFAWSEWDDAANQVAKEKARYAGTLRRLTAVQKAKEADALKVASVENALKRAFEPAQRFSDVFTLISNEAPAGCWLTGLSLERGKEVQIRGVAKTAESVGDYVQRLSRLDRFRDVKLVYANNSTIEKESVVQFSISAFPVGNLPILETRRRSGS